MKRIAIIGGGLAGLCTAIQLARKGMDVTLFEKKNYPFHRVCGEYISNETVPFLKKNGLFPEKFGPSSIHRLQLTSVNGKSVELSLDMGGFGISRYVYDHFLAAEARMAGVNLLENTEVESVQFQHDAFQLKTDKKEFDVELVVGSFGKRSKLDVSLKREFIKQRSPYVGVKYHVKTNHASDLIALHNFKGGYCGVSLVEEEKINICYLTHRENVKAAGSIEEMERAVLFENPFLRKLFNEADFLFDKPEVINEISFEAKSPVEQHVLMCGDAAGMITPLCGNGMAMAIHSSKILSEVATDFCEGKISRAEMEARYTQQWKSLFTTRLWAGRQIQNFFGRPFTSNLLVNVGRSAKPVARFLVSKTHGKVF